MPDTYEYKVRDKSGNMVTGTLVADSELLVLQRLREMGYTPLEVGKEKRGLNLEINVKKAKVKLKDLAVFSRQFATMINSGLPILRALSILADQTENKLLARDPERDADGRRTGRLPVRGHGEAPEGLQRPVRVDGEVR